VRDPVLFGMSESFRTPNRKTDRRKRKKRGRAEKRSRSTKRYGGKKGRTRKRKIGEDR